MSIEPVTLSPAAASRLKALSADEGRPVMLRVAVDGGGCSGFQYSLDLDEAGAKDGDTSFTANGVKCFVDPMSSMYLQGVTVDYVVGLQGAGFKFNNPNARSTCGCGSSFSY